MKRWDTVVIGAGETGHFIADKLASDGKDVFLLKLPGNPEDTLQNLLGSFPSAPKIQAHAVATNPVFQDPKTLLVDGERVTAKTFVMASGCQPHIPEAYRDTDYILPADFLAKEFPATVTIVGAGPIGVFLAQTAAKKDARVTLVSNKDRVLPRLDPALSTRVGEQLAELDVTIKFNTPEPVKTKGTVVLATGLRANTAGFGLEKIFAYVAPDGRLAVDESMRTAQPRLYAAGAVTGPPMSLALERYQAELVAHNMHVPFFMRERQFDDAFPSVFSFDPPVACIGLTEEEATAKYKDAMAVSVRNDAGTVVKVVGRQRSGLLAGAHMAGKSAPELILFFDLAMRAGATLRELTESHHFPSPSDATLAKDAIQAWVETADLA